MILSKSMQDMVDHLLHCIVVLKCNKHLIKPSICHFFQMVLDCQFEVKYIHDNIIQQTYSNELLKCLHMDSDAISHVHKKALLVIIFIPNML